MRNKVVFGYEIGSGKEVQIPVSHTVITGITNESGKTTAVMGFIKRSGLRAIVFKTKIGEKAIAGGTIIPPYYKEIFDWEYMVELLEMDRKEKLKFERPWIIKYSKRATNMLEFKTIVDDVLAKDASGEKKLRELEKSVLITLQAYVDKILPELKYAPLSKTLDIRDGINIMDLEQFKETTQTIIIRSVLNEVLRHEKNILIIIPECWRYLPERISTPVKRPAEAFIRQGATNNNFLILDSQDVTGVAKSILKQVSCWILGLQKEKNEIQRTLDQIPLSKESKPAKKDIPTLDLGQFYVVTSEFTKKCYAQPMWVDDKSAIRIAKGELGVAGLEPPVILAPNQIIVPEQKTKNAESVPNIEATKKINELRADFLSNRSDFFEKFRQMDEKFSKVYGDIYKLNNEKTTINEDEIVVRVLQKMPVGSNLISQTPFNKEELISEILARIPRQAGSVTYTVAPLEKIKKDFLERAKQKIISDVSSLDDEQKKILKFVEAQNKGCSQTHILSKCLFVSATSGGTRKRISDKCRVMANLELVRTDKNTTVYPCLKDRIKSLMGIHDAKQEEIEQVYNHILMEIINVAK